ncbi:hypothetical protein SUGI_0521770 [Cryptomeria japonica]|uniref:gibberellin 2-beta-dioxygenase 8 n=1 Tax=Cryptomeria japonica TaxID=3369 RepID=UPI002408A2B3|nr:gibberellin 2-beta-dioxygenase 8 [Cryptomeria japonica]GLJ26767.1 hypothetical protein SUGI_0521770 [Cryptomeria japonica]
MGRGIDTSYPPLETRYAHLLQDQHLTSIPGEEYREEDENCGPPLLDLQLLRSPQSSSQCAQNIIKACSEWGIFQAINHGVSLDLIQQMHTQTNTLFSLPFEVKKNTLSREMFPYMWGTPIGVEVKNCNWMESFLISPHSYNFQAAASFDGIQPTDLSLLSLTLQEYGRAMSKLGCELLGVLSSEMGLSPSYYSDCFSTADSFIKLNRYLTCTRPEAVYGLEPHTDSGLLTIIHQDQVGGLEILREGNWIGIKPRADALVINVGDLLQAWSNDVCKSVEHRVFVNCNEERVSLAYFLNPFDDTYVLSPNQSGCHYRGFTTKEFRAQVKEDVKLTGSKIGLPHFRLDNVLN